MGKNVRLCLVLLIVVLAGCPEGNSAGDVEFNGEMNVTESGFILNGTVVNTGLSEPTHNDVTIYLYMENGSLITSEQLGELSESNDLPVVLNTEQIPEYVIINSPDFWKHDSISLSYYEYVESEGYYSVTTIGSKDEFPVQVPPNATVQSSSDLQMVQ